MKRNIVIAAVTAAALIGGGTATALAVTGDDDAPARQKDATVTRDDAAPRVESGTVTAADAIAAALKEAPGTAVSAELDDDRDDDGGDDGDDGASGWKVRILADDTTWHTVRIDPANGNVLGSHTGREDDDDDTAGVRAALKGTSVTAEQAAEAAAAKGTVTDVDLDDDGRAKAWDVSTGSGKDDRDWRVDLNTGKVTADSDDDDRNARADDDTGERHDDDHDDD
ncbi:PepSY domain-containing protein [Streptomyces sp. DG2A-72]|uniref:PepSY domain-containing protein n=1 Tax=Streptomyces sp. DG2A-72 TaxID=3051386 RepID=UPI00265BD442|nr:PepSY domain-containing protein [Streptomyces sp. DG2A-72]MDO0936675.1 PepSY domain-containing protein [Streptomyces sp. DG2A-72]